MAVRRAEVALSAGVAVRVVVEAGAQVLLQDAWVGTMAGGAMEVLVAEGMGVAMEVMMEAEKAEKAE